MGLGATFVNLALFVSLDPILSEHLIELGVKEANVGVYFFIYAGIYCIASLLLDKLVLSHIHSRMCLIYGFILQATGFLLIGPS